MNKKKPLTHSILHKVIKAKKGHKNHLITKIPRAKKKYVIMYTHFMHDALMSEGKKIVHTWHMIMILNDFWLSRNMLFFVARALFFLSSILSIFLSFSRIIQDFSLFFLFIWIGENKKMTLSKYGRKRNLKSLYAEKQRYCC